MQQHNKGGAERAQPGAGQPKGPLVPRWRPSASSFTC